VKSTTSIRPAIKSAARRIKEQRALSAFIALTLLFILTAGVMLGKPSKDASKQPASTASIVSLADANKQGESTLPGAVNTSGNAATSSGTTGGNGSMTYTVTPNGVTYHYTPTISATELTLEAPYGYASSVEFTSMGGFSKVEAKNYKTSVLEITPSAWFNDKYGKRFDVKLLSRPVLNDGSMAVTFTATDPYGKETDFQVIVRWKTFKYIVNVGTPQIMAGPGIYGKYVSTPISVAGVPAGDTPTISYTITSNLQFTEGTELSRTFSYSPTNLYPLLSLRDAVKGTEYSYNVHITVNGWSSLDRTITSTFIYQ